MTQRKNFKDLTNKLHTGLYKPVPADTESDWRDVWDSQSIDMHDPLAISLIAGALADRLAWVFHAGYQGMMRYAFPFCPDKGWSSYLVAEDKSGEYAGTALATVEGRSVLSGYKSWVAAADHVDHLVVTANDPRRSENVMVLTSSSAEGVSLSSRDKPGFLGDLSQGYAAFKNVELEDTLIFSSDDLPADFSQSEPHHVLTALNAFMLSQTVRLGGDQGIIDATTGSLMHSEILTNKAAGNDEFSLGLAELDLATSETAETFAELIELRDPALFKRWRKDRGLIKMFSRGLQKRADWLRRG
jgi:hypothetical protein